MRATRVAPGGQVATDLGLRPGVFIGSSLPGTAVSTWLNRRASETLVTDSFDRANSTTTLGSTDGGPLNPLAWTVTGPPAPTIVMGIQTNKAYQSTAQDGGLAYVDTGRANGVLSCDLTTAATAALGGLVFRATDASNFMMARYSTFGGADAWELYKQVAGAYTLLGATTSAGIAASTTYRLEVTFRGPSLIFRVDGLVKASASDSAHSTVTKHGLACNAAGGSAGVRWDNWRFDS